MLSSRGRPIKRKMPADGGGVTSVPEPMPSLVKIDGSQPEEEAESEAAEGPPELDKMAAPSRRRTKSDRRVSTSSDNKIDVTSLPTVEQLADAGAQIKRSARISERKQVPQATENPSVLPFFNSKEAVQTLEDLEPCILKLSKILAFIDAPEFNRTVVGCYVRARVADSDGSTHFMLFQIRSVIDLSEEPSYLLQGVRISKRIRLEGIETEQHLDCISDEATTADEFHTWVEWKCLARQRGDRTHTIPTIGFVQRKAHEIATALQEKNVTKSPQEKPHKSPPKAMPIPSVDIKSSPSQMPKSSPFTTPQKAVIFAPKKTTVLHSAKSSRQQVVQTKEDLQPCALNRARLIQFVNEPFFAQMVAGCFVRVGMLLRRRKSTEKEDITIFRLAEVIGVVEGDQNYRVAEAVETNRVLSIRFPSEHPPCNFIYLERSILSTSNYAFTHEEFAQWKAAMKTGKNPLPLMKFVESKAQELRAHFNQQHASNSTANLNFQDKPRQMSQDDDSEDVIVDVDDVDLSSPCDRDEEDFNSLKLIKIMEAENYVIEKPVGPILKRPRGRPRKTAIPPLGVLDFLATRQSPHAPIDLTRVEIIPSLVSLEHFSDDYKEVLNSLTTLLQSAKVKPEKQEHNYPPAEQDPALRYMVKHGLIANSMHCEKCHRRMVLVNKSDASEQMMWHCPNSSAKCSDRSRSIRAGSIFHGVHTSLAKALAIIFHWSQDSAIRYVKEMVPSATWQLVNVLARVCRELCVEYCKLEGIAIFSEVDQQQDFDYEPWNNTAIRKENRKTFPYCSRTWEDRFRKRMFESGRPIFGALMDEIVRLYPVSSDEAELLGEPSTSMADSGVYLSQRRANSTVHQQQQRHKPSTIPERPDWPAQRCSATDHKILGDELEVVGEEVVDDSMNKPIYPSTVPRRNYAPKEEQQSLPRRPMTIRTQPSEGTKTVKRPGRDAATIRVHPSETPEPAHEVVIRQSEGDPGFGFQLVASSSSWSASLASDLRFEIVPGLAEIESFSNQDLHEILLTLEWLWSTAETPEGRATDHFRRYGGGNITNQTELEPVLEFLVRHGLIANSARCDHCGAQMHLRSRTDQKNMGMESFGLQWECMNHKQELHTSKGIRKGTMFGKAKMNPAQVLIVLYYWSEGLNTVQLKERAQISPHLANEWSKFARQICKKFCEEEMSQNEPAFDDNKLLALAEAERKRVEKQKIGGKHLQVAERAFRERMATLGRPVFNGLMECALKFHPLFRPSSEANEIPRGNHGGENDRSLNPNI